MCNGIMMLGDVCDGDAEAAEEEFQYLGDDVWTVDVDEATGIAYTYWWRTEEKCTLGAQRALTHEELVR